MKQELLRELLAARLDRRGMAMVTDLASGAQRLISRTEAAADPLAAILDQGFRFDQSGVYRTEAGEFFVNIYNPALRLVIIGAVHIAQALIPIAQGAGYAVTVIDPRGAFATGQRFPNIDLHPEWPDEIIPKIGLDSRTALVALTHDPKIDDPALNAALRSNVFYIGALGSKKTQASRRERLAAQGFSPAEIARIHGPIGIDIGAKGAPEIAISIMAEMTRVLRLGE
jgi:xanthine dehydrogenase accessory factor